MLADPTVPVQAIKLGASDFFENTADAFAQVPLGQSGFTGEFLQFALDHREGRAQLVRGIR